jgi:alpha-tubulin suppressor-like RCC1 family protein
VATTEPAPAATTEPAQPLVTLSPSATTTVSSAEGPAVVGWGENFSGQLGGGFINNYITSPVSVPALTGVKTVAAGYHFSLALLNDGTVHGWGGNSYGQLGDSQRVDSFTPTPVIGLSTVTAVAAGGAHAIALLGSGSVATWGGDAFGQLGNGTTGKGSESLGYSSTVPMYLRGPSGVVAVAAGGADDAVLLSNGTVMAWGENSAGQLGDGTTVEKDVPTSVRGLTNVKAIAMGGDSSHGAHLLALLNNGTVMAVGANGSGQLGDGTTENKSTAVQVKGLGDVVAVSASQSHSMALLSDGTIRAWGNNAYGELGVGAGPETCSTPRSTWACSRVPTRVAALSNVTAISAGWRFSLAVSGSRMFSWGWNEMGRLGNGTTVSTSLPVASGPSTVMGISAGEQHSEALLSAGAPPPEVEVSPGLGSLTVTWRSSYMSERWYVARRPRTFPRSEWREWIQLPGPTRSYIIPGLTSGQPYEVIVKNDLYGARTIIGTPR